MALFGLLIGAIAFVWVGYMVFTTDPPNRCCRRCGKYPSGCGCLTEGLDPFTGEKKS